MVQNLPTWVKNDTLLKGILMSLQNQVDEQGNVIEVDSSSCMVTYDDFVATTDGITASQLYSLYESARQAKGQGSGTDIGFMISNFAGYSDVVVAGFNFYNECSMDYYMVSLGANSQNPSGISNLLVNLAFRTLNGEDTILQDLGIATTAFAASADTTTATNLGKACGNAIRTILQVEIPTAQDTEVAYYQTASGFARR